MCWQGCFWWEQEVAKDSCSAAATLAAPSLAAAFTHQVATGAAHAVRSLAATSRVPTTEPAPSSTSTR